MEPKAQREAMLYEQLNDKAVRCGLCGHGCTIQPGKKGLCAVRANEDGTLVSLNFGRLVAANIDPVEKKPLFHVKPGSPTWSIAAVGCNFQCDFCQNWRISQAPREGREQHVMQSDPAAIVAEAIAARCPSISYTYTEPTVYFELAYDTATIAKKAGLRNFFVSNGFMTPAAVEKIAPVLDAINVDLKAFDDATYRTVMKARLAPVLDCLRALIAAKVWVEVTTLLVPGMNDGEGELNAIASFIAGDLGADVPWHVTEYHDDYRMTGRGHTPRSAVNAAVDAGRNAGLRYVYGGNNYDTRCSHCDYLLIAREGFSILTNRIEDGACPKCGAHMPGIWL